jgi:hypothetical protein
MTTEKKIDGRNYLITFDVVPELDADRNIVWHNADAGTSKHNNIVTHVATEKNIVPVSDLWELCATIRDIESKSIIQPVNFDDIHTNHNNQ